MSDDDWAAIANGESYDAGFESGEEEGRRIGYREGYLAGWRAAIEAAATEIGCACQLGCPDTINCRRILVADIRALPEPCAEPSPSSD